MDHYKGCFITGSGLDTEISDDSGYMDLEDYEEAPAQTPIQVQLLESRGQEDPCKSLSSLGLCSRPQDRIACMALTMERTSLRSFQHFSISPAIITTVCPTIVQYP